MRIRHNCPNNSHYICGKLTPKLTERKIALDHAVDPSSTKSIHISI